MKSKVYIIPYDPTPLARVRFDTRGHVYDSQKTVKLMWGLNLRSQHNDVFFEGALHLDVTFYMPVPIRINVKKRQLLFNNPHHTVPDLDNLVKWVCDCCQGILFKNDATVSSITCRKIYSNNPRTELVIETVPYVSL